MKYLKLLLLLVGVGILHSSLPRIAFATDDMDVFEELHRASEASIAKSIKKIRENSMAREVELRQEKAPETFTAETAQRFFNDQLEWWSDFDSKSRPESQECRIFGSSLRFGGGPVHPLVLIKTRDISVATIRLADTLPERQIQFQTAGESGWKTIYLPKSVDHLRAGKLAEALTVYLSTSKE